MLGKKVRESRAFTLGGQPRLECQKMASHEVGTLLSPPKFDHECRSIRATGQAGQARRFFKCGILAVLLELDRSV